MKRLEIILIVVVLAGVAFAQQKEQKPPQGQAQQQQPGKQGPGTAAPAPAPAQPPAGVRMLVQAKSEAEYQAYSQAEQAKTADEASKAADDFAAKFKDSDLRFLLYYRSMLRYQADGNMAHAIDEGRKALSVQPNDPATLAFVATFLTQSTRETDLDKDQRYAEAIKDAETALQTVNTDLSVMPNTPVDQIENIRNVVRSVAYDALGAAYSATNKWADAERSLRKFLEVNTDPEASPIVYLRLAIALDRQNKYQEGLAAANKAVDTIPAGTPQATIAKRERDRLQTLASAPGAQSKPPQAPPK